MHNETRDEFNSTLARQAKDFGYTSEKQNLNFSQEPDKLIAHVSNNKFSVTPSAEQTIIAAAMEHSDFLKRISIFPSKNQQGQAVILDTRPASSVNTSTTIRRQPSDLSDLTDRQFNCQQINTDTFVPYEKLDAWAGAGDFYGTLQQQVARQKALDIMTVGFNGTHRSDPSDIAANPLLQDVAIGWLERYRQECPGSVISGVSVTRRDMNGAVESFGEYSTTDGLINEVWRSCISPMYTTNPFDLVVISSSPLVNEKYQMMANMAGNVPQRNSESLWWDVIMKNQKLGGLPVFPVPGFPDNAAFVTSLDNISLFWQRNTFRRMTCDEPDLNRIANYDSLNMDFIIQDYSKGCLVENIVWGSDGAYEQ